MNHAQALVIDDNDDNLYVLSELLTMNGVQSYTLRRSVELPVFLQTIGHLDVVFVDLEMPRMNGYEVLNALKQHPRFSHIPVVAYTVHTSEIAVAQQIGFHSFLGKPLDADKFSDQLARILNGEPVWAIV
jgi:two-component system cell cycle response regulator DivK